MDIEYVWAILIVLAIIGGIIAISMLVDWYATNNPFGGSFVIQDDVLTVEVPGNVHGVVIVNGRMYLIEPGQRFKMLLNRTSPVIVELWRNDGEVYRYLVYYSPSSRKFEYIRWYDRRR